MAHATAIIWFQNDLRLADHPALWTAADEGYALIPVFIWSPEEMGRWAPGAASRWWLRHSLQALAQELRRHQSRLILRAGKSRAVLAALLEETGAQSVFWNRCYEPKLLKRDRALQKWLQSKGVTVRSFNGALLQEPATVLTRQGTPFRVFTPFWKQCQRLGPPPPPLPLPRRWPSPRKWPHSLRLDSLPLQAKQRGADRLQRFWTPGCQAAPRRLVALEAGRLARYPIDRDRPALTATSRLSPHLHFGELSARTLWHHVQTITEGRSQRGLVHGGEAWLRELYWREFAAHLLYHFPDTAEQPLRAEFKRFPWRRRPSALRAWQEGRTGYPIVDAGMRELWETGWMHNRLRMIVASFLVKDLLISWRAGAEWFWERLVDADLANNTLGWQWTAGCGADAAPFFRIFNPVLQGQKFDPDGAYVRRWVPELTATPNKWLHRPWQAPAHVLRQAKLRLGTDYPQPIVDHNTARQWALQAYRSITKRGK